MNDTDNWSIDNESFNIINNKYGPFSVDRFANNLNKKVNKFNSKYFCPGTSHVNAFTDDWCRDHNWLCPPISCIGSVLRHLILCKARRGTTCTYLAVFLVLVFILPRRRSDGRFREARCRDRTVLFCRSP